MVTFTNTGTTVCLLDDVRLRRPSDPSFHLRAGGVDQRQLAPGEVHTVIISGPDAGSSERTSQLGFHVLNPNGDRQFVELRVAP